MPQVDAGRKATESLISDRNQVWFCRSDVSGRSEMGSEMFKMASDSFQRGSDSFQRASDSFQRASE